MAATSTQQPTDTSIVIRRDFDATRERLWDAWTKDDQIELWFGPEGFSTRVEANEVRIGGYARYVMIGPDGTEYPSNGTFRDVVPGRRIVTTDEWGEGIDKALPDVDLPQGMIVTYTFKDRDGGRSSLEIQIDHPTAEEKQKHEDMGVVAGWNSSLDKLDRYLTAGV